VSITDIRNDKLQRALETKLAFQDEIVRNAESRGADPTPEEQRMFADATESIKAITEEMRMYGDRMELVENARAANERLNLATQRVVRPDNAPEYRTAGAYIVDYWQASAGVAEARDRIEVYNRVAAHQTTANSTGLLPSTIEQPVINMVDSARPLVNFLGPRNAPTGPTFIRPQVTQHTVVGKQSAEKAELASGAMVITKLTVTMETWGGYVNVSRQLIDWSTPSAMDLIINDLAAQYAVQTEDAVGDAMVAGGTAGPTLPATPTPADIVAVLWAGAAAVYAATKNAGRVFAAASADVIGKLGPAFAPVNPTNAQSPGFAAGDFSSGVVGVISGIPIVMSPPLATGTLIVASTAAVEVYEQRIGALSVVEPSVLGVQVAYAGHFGSKVIVAGGVQKVTVTP
jgi:HK97 family phage major capsid protein